MTEIFPVSILLSITKMHGFPEFFSDFELCWLAISQPVDLGESYIHQKKALNSGN